jgi:hypothetical protein
MRHHMTKLAVTAAGCLMWAGALHGQTLLNGDFSQPVDATDSTSTTATAWSMSPAGTNLGQRATFHQNAGEWAFWLQDFEPSGTATQTVTAVVPGVNYSLSALWAFELGASGATGANGFNAVTLANNPSNTGNLVAYMSMQFQTSGSANVGAADVLNITAGSIPTADNADSFANAPASPAPPWLTESIAGIAPVGASQVLVTFGWLNGGGDGGTGSQSGFATDVTLAPVAVPEPASLGVITLGGLALLARRRTA